MKTRPQRLTIGSCSPLFGFPPHPTFRFGLFLKCAEEYYTGRQSHLDGFQSTCPLPGIEGTCRSHRGELTVFAKMKPSTILYDSRPKSGIRNSNTELNDYIAASGSISVCCLEPKVVGVGSQTEVSPTEYHTQIIPLSCAPVPT